MGYEKKLARSFSQAEPQKLTYGLLLGCFMVLLLYISMSNPYDALLTTISLQLSTSRSLQSDSILPDMLTTSVPEKIVAGTGDANHESEFSCSNLSSIPSDRCKRIQVMQRNTSSYVAKMVASPAAQAIQANITPFFAEKLQPMCDFSNRRSDICELEGEIRILTKQMSVLLITKSQHKESWRVRPYARKSDATAMSNVAEISVKASQIHEAPQCTHNHTVPAVIFSVAGYTGNFFHDFTDVLLPLFQTSRHFNGTVQFLVADFRSWWINKYLHIFKALSHYNIINLNNPSDEDSVHCFPTAIVGLRSHDDLTIDPLMSRNGHSMTEFTKFLRTAYSLPRDEPITVQEMTVKKKKPRLLIIARSRTRRFVNLEKILSVAEGLGFEVVVGEAAADVALFARVVNSCDVMMGVHGAGLTNLVFLPTNAVVVQVVPWGKLDWIARISFGKPAKSMQLKYLEYDIKEAESTLSEIYGRDDPVFADPYSIHKLGWLSVKEIYLEKQNVKVDVRRFRAVLDTALEMLRQK